VTAINAIASNPLLTNINVFDHEVRQCRVWLTPEEDGGFSVEAVSVPGVASQGETIEEAIENIKDAFTAAIETYNDSGMDIPWTQDLPEERPANVIERWILVNV